MRTSIPPEERRRIAEARRSATRDRELRPPPPGRSVRSRGRGGPRLWAVGPLAAAALVALGSALALRAVHGLSWEPGRTVLEWLMPHAR